MARPPGQPARAGRLAPDQRRDRIHHDDPAFGYRFIADELGERGLRVGENRVARLCSGQRIWSVFAKKPGLTRKAGPPVHDDLVDRQFTATGPHVVWLTDITEHRTAEGKLYLSAIKDVYSGRIVSYSIDDRMKASLAVTALRNAIARRGRLGKIVHSDRGSQFRSNALVRTLKNDGLIGSMGRVGACGDNAPMESFLALRQKSVLDRQRWGLHHYNHHRAPHRPGEPPAHHPVHQRLRSVQLADCRIFATFERVRQQITWQPDHEGQRLLV